MKKINFLQLTALFFVLFTCVASNSSYAQTQTIVNLPAPCNCADPDTDGDGTLNSTDDDDDGDGVLDVNDTCPLFYGTGADGCPEAGGTDTDGDGVPDLYDDCPNTVAGGSSDPDFNAATGCIGVDTDGDGVPDDMDDCPTVSGTEANGCPTGTVTPGAGACGSPAATEIVEVVSATGQIWMDRNLGAERAAQSVTDYDSYGCLYQWGRLADGHELIQWSSSTTGTRVNAGSNSPSSTWEPTTINYINAQPTSNSDWYIGSQDDILSVWSGVNGINNPCPTGWRIPNKGEWEAEIAEYTDHAGFWAAGLKFPRAGFAATSLQLTAPGSIGNISLWTSTPIHPATTSARQAYYARIPDNANPSLLTKERSNSFPVRCIKDSSSTDSTGGSGGAGGTDTDNDGVPDLYDDCPNTVAGGSSDPDFNAATGCIGVDTDGDGVPDAMDDCPTVAGTEANGCPTGTVVPGAGLCGSAAATEVVEITSATGRIWMDRNLGASRAAQDDTDYEAYGCSYQWGRGSDGHELVQWQSSTVGTRANATVTTQATSWDAGHGNYIQNTTNFDWYDGPQDDLFLVWTGVNGINNPCPTGFRLPIVGEWEAEIDEYNDNWDNLSDALKLTRVGNAGASGTIAQAGVSGFYWSGSHSLNTSGNSRQAYQFKVYTTTDIITTEDEPRVNGNAVRCIKD